MGLGRLCVRARYMMQPDEPRIQLKPTRLRRRVLRALSGALAFAVTVTSFPSPDAWAQHAAAPLPATNPLVDLTHFDPALITVPSAAGRLVESWRPAHREPAGFAMDRQARMEATHARELFRRDFRADQDMYRFHRVGLPRASPFGLGALPPV